MKFLTIIFIIVTVVACSPRYVAPTSGPTAQITFNVPLSDSSKVYDKLRGVRSLEGSLGVYDDYNVCKNHKGIATIIRGKQANAVISANTPITMQSTLSFGSQDYSRGFIARNLFTFIPKTGHSYLITNEIDQVYGGIYFDIKTTVKDIGLNEYVDVAQRKIGCVRSYENIPSEEYAKEINSTGSKIAKKQSEK